MASLWSRHQKYLRCNSGAWGAESPSWPQPSELNCVGCKKPTSSLRTRPEHKRGRRCHPRSSAVKWTEGGGVGCSALSGWVTYIHEGVGVEDSLEVVEEIEIFGELLLCSARRSSCRSVFLFHWAGGGAGSGQRLSPQVQRPPRQMRTSAGAVLGPDWLPGWSLGQARGVQGSPDWMPGWGLQPGWRHAIRARGPGSGDTKISAVSPEPGCRDARRVCGWTSIVVGVHVFFTHQGNQSSSQCSLALLAHASKHNAVACSQPGHGGPGSLMRARRWEKTTNQARSVSRGPPTQSEAGEAPVVSAAAGAAVAA